MEQRILTHNDSMLTTKDEGQRDDRGRSWNFMEAYDFHCVDLRE